MTTGGAPNWLVGGAALYREEGGTTLARFLRMQQRTMAEMMRKTMIATTIVTGMEIWRFSRYHEAATLRGGPAVQTVFLHVPASVISNQHHALRMNEGENVQPQGVPSRNDCWRTMH